MTDENKLSSDLYHWSTDSVETILTDHEKKRWGATQRRVYAMENPDGVGMTKSAIYKSLIVFEGKAVNQFVNHSRANIHHPKLVPFGLNFFKSSLKQKITKEPGDIFLAKIRVDETLKMKERKVIVVEEIEFEGSLCGGEIDRICIANLKTWYTICKDFTFLYGLISLALLVFLSEVFDYELPSVQLLDYLSKEILFYAFLGVLAFIICTLWWNNVTVRSDPPTHSELKRI